MIKKKFLLQKPGKKILEKQPDLYICTISLSGLETLTLMQVFFLVIRHRLSSVENVLKIWIWVIQKGKTGTKKNQQNPTSSFLWLLCCLGSRAWLWSILINRVDKHNLLNSSCIWNWSKEQIYFYFSTGLKPEIMENKMSRSLFEIIRQFSIFL